MNKTLIKNFATKYLNPKKIPLGHKHNKFANEPPVNSNGMILYLEGINKSFDGFKAINDLNLYIEEGELRCIIGPNGAG